MQQQGQSIAAEGIRGESIIELEHTIGFSGSLPRSVLLHPNGEDLVYISGRSIVIANLADSHQQDFLFGHDDQVTALAISNKGHQIASGQRGDNSDVIIWDFQKRKALFKLSEHDHEVISISFSTNDRLLLTCGNYQDQKIIIWDTQTGYIVGSSSMIPGRVNVLTFGGFVKDLKNRDKAEYQFATAGTKQICLFALDAQTGQVSHDLINTGAMFRNYICLEFTADREQYLLAGSQAGELCGFQVKTRSLIFVIPVSALGLQVIKALSSERIVVGCGDGIICQFDMEENRPTFRLKTQLQGCAHSISQNCDGKEIMCATNKGHIYRVRNSDLATALHSENHTDSIVHLTYRPRSSDHFASCSEDGSILLWDISEDYRVERRIGLGHRTTPLCLAYTDEVVLSGWLDGGIRLFSVETGKMMWEMQNCHKGGVTTLCLAENMKYFCSGGQEGDVRVWEMRSRSLVSHLKEHTAKVTKVLLMADGMSILSSSKDKTMLQWDLKQEKRSKAWIQRMGGINDFALMNDNNTALVCGQDKLLTFWQLDRPEPIRQLPSSTNIKQQEEILSVSISPTNRLFATGGAGRIVKVWDTQKGNLLGEGQAHSGQINTVTFSYDERQICSGGSDGNLMIWNIYNE